MTRFTSFILLAEMRTGSNLLESNLNVLDGVVCHGEAFNPSFIGDPKADTLLGVTLKEREADPLALLERMKASSPMPGFRYFHNHDPRVFDPCLNDPTCAKIILTRDPVDSFVSWKIAQATGQWKLTNATHARTQAIRFDPAAFKTHVSAVNAFRQMVEYRLKTSGQTAYRLSYSDLRDVDVINGLAAFLGVEARLTNVKKRLKKQNPGTLAERVTNVAEMQQALAAFHQIDPDHALQMEPARGPMIPTYIAAPKSGLLYCPLRSGPDQVVRRWLAAVDQTDVDQVQSGFSRNALRDWLNAHAPHRCFAVIRHPVARAHAAFCDRILYAGPQNLAEIRATLRRVHDLPIPEEPVARGASLLDAQAHRAAFLGFLRFLRQNIGGQTSIRVDPSWASQQVLLQGIAQIKAPDLLIREDDLAAGLKQIANEVGIANPPELGRKSHSGHAKLLEIYDNEIEQIARRAYARDYTSFGFGDFA